LEKRRSKTLLENIKNGRTKNKTEFQIFCLYKLQFQRYREMKRISNIVILLLFVEFAAAQIQVGFVKTKGRLVNGKHVQGTGLPGATVGIQGGNNVGVRNKDGSFSFILPSKTYMVQSVKKSGYELVDADALKRSYQYSANPLYLVMETPEQLRSDMLEAKDRLRETLFLEYKRKNEELKRQLAENRIKKEDYERLKTQLDSVQDCNEQLINSMAEQYARIDYDQENEVMRHVHQLIINGNLTKADSLLKVHYGNLSAEVNSFRLFSQQNAKKRLDQVWRDSLESVRRTSLERQCYIRHQVYKLKHEHDSAKHYIELRAELDTTCVSWQLEAGLYIDEFCLSQEVNSVWERDRSCVMFYYQRALRNAIALYGENSPEAGNCYFHIGMVEDTGVDIDYYKKALSLMEYNFGKDSREAANCWRKIGKTYNSWHPDTRLGWDEGCECLERAAIIYDKLDGKDNIESLLCRLECALDDKNISKIVRKLELICANDKLLLMRVYRNIGEKYSYETDAAQRDYGDTYYWDVNKQDAEGNYLYDEFDKTDWKVWENGNNKIIKHNQRMIDFLKKGIPYLEKAHELMVEIYGSDYIPCIELLDHINIEKDTMEGCLAEQAEAIEKLDIAKKYKKQIK